MESPYEREQGSGEHPSGDRFEHETEGNRRVTKDSPIEVGTTQGEGDHPSGDRFEHETEGNRRTGLRNQ